MSSRLQYAVFGQPVAHSLSPRIHAMFAMEFGIALDYCRIEAGRDAFAEKLETFARDGGRGANLTLPLKQDASSLCFGLSARARRCGSVNTLIRDVDGWHGDSTDGSGLLRDLADRHTTEPRECRCLLIGAGGAARAIAFALADAGARRLVIVNRTAERASVLADDIGDPPRVEAIAFENLARAGAFDLVLHATAAGHDRATLELPRTLLAPNALCYDLSYGDAARPFLQWARDAGAPHVSDGLGMLIEQAAESFSLWHGRAPDTKLVYAELRRAIAATGIAL